ncbi:MAG: hypothetical protein ABJF10_17310 [Chthoniobacter sp.]|uniref:hypothetical protein n=1 Tax=Chthoniobacter sp. TaxID=2510640 RepID=UPI0032A82B38
MSDPHQTSLALNLKEDGQPLIDLNGLKIDVPGPMWFRVTVAIVVLILALYSFIWITEDAQKRGKSGCLAFLFIFAAGWPLSLLWWIWLRPKLEKTPAAPPPTLPPEIP